MVRSRARRSVRHLLTDDLTHRRGTRVSDGQGGWTESGAGTSTVKGRVSPARAADLEVGRQRQARVTHAIYMLPDQDVRMGDQIVHKGRTFEITVAEIEPSIDVYHKSLAEWTQDPS